MYLSTQRLMQFLVLMYEASLRNRGITGQSAESKYPWSVQAYIGYYFPQVWGFIAEEEPE